MISSRLQGSFGGILRVRDFALKSAGVELEEEQWKERRDGFEQAYSPGVLLLWVSGRYSESLTSFF